MGEEGSLTALSCYNQPAKYSQWLTMISNVFMYLMTVHYDAEQRVPMLP